MTWDARSEAQAEPMTAMVIGNMTGKICAYSVRIKDCRNCQFYSNKGLTPPPPHTCHKNLEGISKAFKVCVTGIADTILIFRELNSLTDVQKCS